jgi:type III secretory pathway component EscV
VESTSGQSSDEFADVLSRSKFQDGSTMLPALHSQGRLIKVPTDKVEMIPNFSAKVNLAELNQIIAGQRGIAVDDLAVKDRNAITQDHTIEVQEVAKIKDISPGAKTTSSSVNEEVVTVTEPAVDASPESAAKHYRSQADKLAKQAAEFRRKAEELAPTKKVK